MTTPHEHGPDDQHDHDGDHDHGPQQDDGSVAMRPQPIPQNVQAELVVLQDGTDRVKVTYTSVNGSWVVFYDREGAKSHAQALLGLAFSPPVAPPAQADAQPPVLSSEPTAVPGEEPPAAIVPDAPAVEPAPEPAAP